jgi:hypothetical protein
VGGEREGDLKNCANTWDRMLINDGDKVPNMKTGQKMQRRGP